MQKKVSNPGSAIGEAIGCLMENALNCTIGQLVQPLGYIHVTAGPRNVKTGKVTKLLLTDKNGVEYNIDSVIANKKLQPLILVESKYIRYKKHNRDKGSWVCTAHQSLRRRYSSVRSSITILAGNWSKTSKAMMKSFDITLFEIPFQKLCEILQVYEITYDWDEKDRDAAFKAWNRFCELSQEEYDEIGNAIISSISGDLRETIQSVLDVTIPREISEVEIQIVTNLGELKIFNFEDVQSALEFLQDIDNDEILSTKNSPSLFDNSTLLNDE